MTKCKSFLCHGELFGVLLQDCQSALLGYYNHSHASKANMSGHRSMDEGTQLPSTSSHPLSLPESSKPSKPFPYSENQHCAPEELAQFPYSDSASVYTINPPSLTFSSDGASLVRPVPVIFKFGSAEICHQGRHGFIVILIQSK